MPNTFAYLTLYAWPVVVLILFRILPKNQALIWSILGGYLFLPFGVEVNFPLLPSLDKTFIPSVFAGIAYLWFANNEKKRQRITRVKIPEPIRQSVPISASRLPYSRQHRPASTTPDTKVESDSVRANPRHYPRAMLLVNGLLALLLLVPFLTALVNGDTIIIGPRYLPGLTLYDAFSMELEMIIRLVPFVLGLYFLGTRSNHLVLLIAFGLFGLIYSFPTLFEIRMSPQLSRWTYGFLAQSFAQTMRDGGFRPVVFLQHGLWLAIFLTMAALASFVVWRERMKKGNAVWYFFLGLWLTGVLLLASSLGAVLVLFLLLPVVIFMGQRSQLVIASVIAISMLIYPIVRSEGLLPYKAIQEFARSVNPEREQSFTYRLENEEVLLQRANERPLLGWGGYGRARVYDPWSGKAQTVSDGAWIVLIGYYGWVGYLAEFGLLTLPIFLLTIRRTRIHPSLATTGLCIVLSANLIDMITNATVTVLTWLIAGALTGLYRNGAAVDEAPVTQNASIRRRQFAMTRATGSAGAKSK